MFRITEDPSSGSLYNFHLCTYYILCISWIIKFLIMIQKLTFRPVYIADSSVSLGYIVGCIRVPSRIISCMCNLLSK